MKQTPQDRSPTFCRAADGEIEQLDPGIRRRILGYGPDIMLCRVWFEKGVVGQVHSHPHSQTTYIESGRFRVTIDGEEREFAAGDAFYVAPHLDHGSLCLEAGVLIDAFSPARADFLKREG
jgi:quercetin dioxygenase-like cupin family protein